MDKDVAQFLQEFLGSKKNGSFTFEELYTALGGKGKETFNLLEAMMQKGIVQLDSDDGYCMRVKPDILPDALYDLPSTLRLDEIKKEASEDKPEDKPKDKPEEDPDKSEKPTGRMTFSDLPMEAKYAFYAEQIGKAGLDFLKRVMDCAEKGYDRRALSAQESKIEKLLLQFDLVLQIGTRLFAAISQDQYNSIFNAYRRNLLYQTIDQRLGRLSAMPKEKEPAEVAQKYESAEAQKTPQEVYEDLCNALEKHGYEYREYERDDDEDYFLLVPIVQDATILSFFQINNDVSFVMWNGYLRSFVVPSDKTEELALLLMTINNYLAHGSFAYDAEYGISFRISNSFSGNTVLGEKVFIEMLEMGYRMIEVFAEYFDLLLNQSMPIKRILKKINKKFES